MMGTMRFLLNTPLEEVITDVMLTTEHNDKHKNTQYNTITKTIIIDNNKHRATDKKMLHNLTKG